MWAWLDRLFGKGQQAAPQSAPESAPADRARIEELVRSFDEGNPAAERAHRELSHIGSAAVPALVAALQGGANRRFYAARTFGSIGMNAQCGLATLDEASATTALVAVDSALRSETEEPIRMSLLRAQRNLQECQEYLARRKRGA